MNASSTQPGQVRDRTCRLHIHSSSHKSNRSCLGTGTCCHRHLKAPLLFFNYRTQIPSGHLIQASLQSSRLKTNAILNTISVSDVQRDRIIFMLTLQKQQSFHYKKFFFMPYKVRIPPILRIYATDIDNLFCNKQSSHCY